MKKLKRDFYDRDTLIVAKELIGKILVRKYNGKKIMSRITETEAYKGEFDKASHSYNGITSRNQAMFGPAGFTYVYFIYGMYYCLNIVTEHEGSGSAVLIRGVEPIENIEDMCLNRYNKTLDELTRYQLKNISNGPGKICNALHITREDNGIDLIENDIYVVDDGFEDFSIESTKRINIDYAEESKDFLWRFLLKANENRTS